MTKIYQIFVPKFDHFLNNFIFEKSSLNYCTVGRVLFWSIFQKHVVGASISSSNLKMTLDTRIFDFEKCSRLHQGTPFFASIF